MPAAFAFPLIEVPCADGGQQEVVTAVRNRCPAKLLPIGHKRLPSRIAACEVIGPVIEVDCGLSIDGARHIKGVGIVRVGKVSVRIERDGEDGASSGRTGQYKAAVRDRIDDRYAAGSQSGIGGSAMPGTALFQVDRRRHCYRCCHRNRESRCRSPRLRSTRPAVPERWAVGTSSTMLTVIVPVAVLPLASVTR